MDAYTKSWVYYNGVLSDTQIQPDIDTAWLNIYEVARAQSSVLLFAEDHYARFTKSLAIAGKACPWLFTDWKNEATAVLEANHLTDNNVRFDLYYGPNGLELKVISAIPSHYPSQTQREQGVATVLQHAERRLPNAKTTDLKVRGSANEMIAKACVFETLLVNHNNEITEGSRSNFFAIKSNTLITAPDHLVLQGIMRNKTLEAAAHLGIGIDYRALAINEIPTLDAAFVTGTSPRVLPINKIDDHTLPIGHPMVQTLFMAIEEEVETYILGKKG